MDREGRADEEEREGLGGLKLGSGKEVCTRGAVEELERDG